MEHQQPASWASAAGDDPDGHVAKRLDQLDVLRKFRAEFYLPGDRIYLDGNSLGLLCRPAEAALLSSLQEWRELAIGGWLDADPPWFQVAERLGAELGEIVGARQGEVVVCGSTTVNLHQLLTTFFDPSSPRRRILIDDSAFPTDRYAVESHLRMRGLDPSTSLCTVKRQDGTPPDDADLMAAFDESVQLAVLPAVIYTNGRLLDMQRLTAEAHRRGLQVAFDCSHSVGVIPHALAEWDVDYAFFCTYKYLNGGPGSPAAVFVNQRHWGKTPGLAGWFGGRKDLQFDMAATFVPAHDAGAMQIGTPHILSMSPLFGSLALIRRAGIKAIREKSQQLTTYLRALIAARLKHASISFADPDDAALRGGHIAVRHADAAGISRALRAAGVICDFRPPDILRLAPVPLYTSFDDCYRAVNILDDIVRSGQFARGGGVREQVP